MGHLPKLIDRHPELLVCSIDSGRDLWVRIRAEIVRAGTQVRLTKTEWGLLEALCQHPGKLLTRRWLLERVWGPKYADDVDVLRVFISQLRKKLEAEPGRPRIITTDPGIGYRWMLQPADNPEYLPP